MTSVSTLRNNTSFSNTVLWRPKCFSSSTQQTSVYISKTQQRRAILEALTWCHLLWAEVKCTTHELIQAIRVCFKSCDNLDVKLILVGSSLSESKGYRPHTESSPPMTVHWPKHCSPAVVPARHVHQSQLKITDHVSTISTLLTKLRACKIKIIHMLAAMTYIIAHGFLK